MLLFLLGEENGSQQPITIFSGGVVVEVLIVIFYYITWRD
jgi:hypothetical protein